MIGGILNLLQRVLDRVARTVGAWYMGSPAQPQSQPSEPPPSQLDLMDQEPSVLDQEAQVSGRKTWITREDCRVRPTHVQMHGVTVELSEYFLVGGCRAKYPRDPDLPLKEKINCRCVITIEYDKSPIVNYEPPLLPPDQVWFDRDVPDQSGKLF